MITDIQKRAQNMLANRKEEVPKVTTAVEPKRADHQFWRRFNKAQDNNNLTDIQKRIQNMLDNPDGQFKKAVQQGQIKITDTEKDIFDAAPEDVDTSSQDNKDFNLGDVAQTLGDFANLANPVGQMMFLGENLAGDNQGLNNEDVRDTIGDALPEVVSDGAEVVSDGAEAAKKTVDKTVNNLLPANIGKNLGLALYGIIAVAGIAVFVYILSLLKPLFEIGSNVSEK